jgi:hypothetical protein
LDGGGIHKYQEYLLPENLVIRTATKQVGMVLMEHRWRLGEQLPRPLPQAADAAPKVG